MNCPIDDTPLAFSKQQGVEIDYCPKCRGVWLDREKLETIIERSVQASLEQREQDGATQGQKPSQAPSAPEQKPISGADIAGIVGDLISQGLEERRQSNKSGDQSKRKKKGGLLGQFFNL